MGRFSDSRRTARGFKELRNRYIRRANFLCTDPDFVAALETVKASWIEDFPMYPLDKPIHSSPGVFPWKRLEDTTREPHAIEPGGGIRWDTDRAIRHWDYYIWWLEFHYFNAEDFYVVGRQPARAFLQEALLRDPRLLIGDTERLFDLPTLELTIDRSEYDALGLEPEEWELLNPDQRWFIPVYPGMTADDLREAVPRIIEQIQVYLGPQTVGARIEWMHARGLTQQSIADALGLNVKVVQAHLRTVRDQ
jgi:hypothetical protein